MCTDFNRDETEKNAENSLRDEVFTLGVQRLAKTV